MGRAVLPVAQTMRPYGMVSSCFSEFRTVISLGRTSLT
jgi:hypothetical protein